MKYTIYKITNLLDAKIYIGKHICRCNPCKYFGSGKRLKYAIGKYGIENFKKEILYVFETEEEMNAKEAELVSEEFVSRDDTYNICFGGKGGWSYVNKAGLSGLTSEACKKGGKIAIKKLQELNLFNSMKQKRAEKLQERHKLGIIKYDNMRGKKHSEETKIKMKFSASGSRGSQFGTIWITNGIENKKMKKDEFIPEGWYKGRIITTQPRADHLTD